MSRELIDAMSDIVWAINPQKDHLRNLLQRMRHFASQVFIAQKKVFQDEQNPETVLVARKAGKAIAQGQTVSVQVRNGQGKVSNEFMYTRPSDQAADERN